LPQPNAAVDTSLVITATADVDRWERTFDGRRVETEQRGLPNGELVERFGILEFQFHIERSGGSLVYVQRQAALRLGRRRLQLPRSCAPCVAAREDPAGDRSIKVDVRVVLPHVGLIIGYDGIVEVEDRM